MTFLRRFWKDDNGGLLSAEYLLLGTLLVIGLLFAVHTVKDALITKIQMIVDVVCQF